MFNDLLSGDLLRTRPESIVWTPCDRLLVHLAGELHEMASISDALSTHPTLDW
jgi:hypothetical protein